jgi:hypothetical protein
MTYDVEYNDNPLHKMWQVLDRPIEIVECVHKAVLKRKRERTYVWQDVANRGLPIGNE